jgi:pimeloyl-ACP methyl ester carboxylesterase/ketosteroid isomerase-like protein
MMNTPDEEESPTISAAATVQAYFTAFASGDIEGTLALMTEDVVWHVAGSTDVSTVGLLRGRARVRNWLTSFPESFIPRVFAIDRLFENSDVVIAFGRFRHTVRATGRTVGSNLAIRFTVHDGLIARYQILEDSLLLSRAFDPADPWDQHKVRINGVTYAYSDRGEGPIVVFAHGLFVDRTIFDAQVATLEASHRCIVLDMPGHGRSGYRKEDWTLDDIADDLALMIEELSLGPVAFVGQSQGGMVGLRLAARRQELVSRLVLIGTSARAEYPERLDDWRALHHTLLHGSEAELEAAFASVQQRINGPIWLAGAAEAARHERSVMLAHDRTGIALALEAASLKREDVRALLPNILAPTLILCGDADRATPLELSQEMASAIVGGRLQVLPGVGHHPPLEAPTEVAAALKAFLR